MDRNQILDGVIMLHLGPQGFREALGYEFYEPIPVEILLNPDTAHSDISIWIEKERNSVNELGVSSAAVAHGRSVREYGWLYQRADQRASELAYSYSVSEARDSWCAAICLGQFDVAPWNSIDAIVPTYGELPAADSEVYELCTRLCHENFNRSEVVAEIDRTSLSDVQRAIVFDWWNQAYLRALSRGRHCTSLSFIPLESSRYRGHEGLARHLGVLGRRRTRTQLFWERIGLGSSPHGKDMRIEGEISDYLGNMSPALFRQLCKRTTDVANRYWQKPSGRRMFDLALPLRQEMEPPPIRSKQWPTKLARIIVLSLIALVLGIRDASPESLGGWQHVWVLWFLIVVLLGMPWGDIMQFVSLRPSQMVATISITGSAHDAPRPR